VFDRQAPAAADAEVFALFAMLLKDTTARPVTGDIGILMAAVRGLDTTPRRKAALLRHIWRPKRFRALLDRFAGRAPMPEARTRLLERLAQDTPEALMTAAGTFTGLRAPEEITARAAALIEDAATAPIAAPEAALLYDLLSLEAPAQAALTHLRGITPLLPAIAPAVDRFATRLDALKANGIDITTLPFQASHGRTSLEYYDGFVFSFHAADPALPPVASGGRYDALTAVLGQGRSIPAVGGVIRPGLVAALKGA
jgi:ATP phosphoribosyltransferase regulatory subunit